MRCHCYDGLLQRKEDVYTCDLCGDTGTREDDRDGLGPFLVMRSGAERSIHGGYWLFQHDIQFIVHWLNIHDVSHVAAFKFVCENGRWPDGFLPEKVCCRQGWIDAIKHKMSNAWMKMVLSYEKGA